MKIGCLFAGRALMVLLAGIFLFSDFAESYAEDKSFMENVNLPEVQTSLLKNRMRLFYVRDELPQLTIILSVGFGKLYENRKNAGISSFLAKTLSMSGSAGYPGKTLHEKIEATGGNISIVSSWEETQIRVQVLARFADLAFDVISDLMLNPKMDSVNIEKARSLLLEEVRRRDDSADRIAFEKAREIIFDGSGYGSVMNADTLKSISRKDLLAAWEKYFRGSNLIAGISTSMDFSSIKKRFNEKLSFLAQGET